MKVGLLDKILAAPGGWDTALGREYGGLELSLGEWQRLAIARMLVKEAPFLVIDEPTSAIDPSGEAAILEAILEAAQDRTLILVTHRISWAQRCDVVARELSRRPVAPRPCCPLRAPTTRCSGRRPERFWTTDWGNGSSHESGGPSGTGPLDPPPPPAARTSA